MFEYPPHAIFDRVIAKSKLYGYAKPTKAVRDRFVAHVAEIVWLYKLSPETTNLTATAAVPEFQVFSVRLREAPIANAVLRDLLLTIDKAVPSPIVHQVVCGDRVRYAAAYKRPVAGRAAAGVQSVVGAYFDLPWEPTGGPLLPLPVALDLGGLYEQVLRRHLPYPARVGEGLAEQVERMERIRHLEAECRRLEGGLGKERQFNRQMELHSALRRQEAELGGLRAV